MQSIALDTTSELALAACLVMLLGGLLGARAGVGWVLLLTLGIFSGVILAGVTRDVPTIWLIIVLFTLCGCLQASFLVGAYFSVNWVNWRTRR